MEDISTDEMGMLRAKRQKREKDSMDYYSRLMRALAMTDWDTTVQLLRSDTRSLNVVVDNWTPLQRAIHTGRVDFVKLLVSHGALLDHEGDEWQSTPPLHYACSCRRPGILEVVKCLLDMGANVNETHDINEPPLHRAVLSRNPMLISLLLEKGASIDPDCGRYRSPLSNLFILFNNASNMIAVLMRHGVSIISYSTQGWRNSLLHYGVMCRMKECVILLMECGARPSSVMWTELRQNCDPAFFAWCRQYMSQPLSLKCLSGQVVRQRLVETHKKSILPYLDQLALTKSLKGYLALDRFNHL